jgi:hypothetical protein
MSFTLLESLCIGKMADNKMKRLEHLIRLVYYTCLTGLVLYYCW